MDNRVSVKIGDKIYTDEMVGFRYKSGTPEIRKQPTGWRRIVRALTPHRYRKPLPIVRPATVGGMPGQIGGEAGDVLSRHYERLDEIRKSLETLG